MPYSKWIDDDSSYVAIKLDENLNKINTMKKTTRKTKPKKKNIQPLNPAIMEHEHQYIVDELARLRTKYMILEDNMDRSISELRNSVAMLSSRILENWHYESTKNTWVESKSPARAYPSRTWNQMKDKIKISIFDNIISKFKH
jgi:hypothetical protein